MDIFTGKVIGILEHQKELEEIKAKTHRETRKQCWRDINGKFNSRPKEIDQAIFITESSRDDLRRKWGIK